MRSTRKDWRQSVADRRDGLLVRLYKAKAPYAELKRAVLAQEKELIRETRTHAERLHIQRITAKHLLTEAYAEDVGWEEFGVLLRRIKRLGSADMTHRIHVACLYVQSLPRFPEKAREAFAMLDDVERRLKRILKSHYLRREGMRSIAHARAVSAASGISPPA
ncbi:hypothetical protein POL68_24625 [Stigmatella sp. ncwal1]|uniref:Transposase n=1 Tax=Stigmatella ashevillensis TaxID=2995309 RepID=A0ABT5DH36_9BACT|nr:hypothetical protein [Stigmatella ashevillena]MDC0711676.1 hypothetical protein [Stigmatella ashevillena]